MKKIYSNLAVNLLRHVIPCDCNFLSWLKIVCHRSPGWQDQEPRVREVFCCSSQLANRVQWQLRYVSIYLLYIEQKVISNSWFFKKKLVDTCPLWGKRYPCFWTSGDVSPGFQSQSGQSHLHLVEAYWFPEIYWYDIYWSLDGQNGSQALFPTFMFQQR